MAETTIPCPQCGSQIKLTEALAADLLAPKQREFEQALAKKNAEFAQHEIAMRQREAALAREREMLDQRVADEIRAHRPLIAAEEAKKAKLALGNDIEQKSAENAALRRDLEQKEAKLAEAQKAQADALKATREAEDMKREIPLTIARGVQEQLVPLREQAAKFAEERFSLKLAEKDQTLAALQKQIEELKRKSEQGSQQLQGEVLELKLESLLREKFPHDSIEPVPKGEYGGDVFQRVFGPGGKRCGAILWESKRTKNWSDTWLSKLRDDQRAAKADLAILVSQTLPKHIESFDFFEGVWISDLRCIIPVAVALRHTLIEVASARQALEGQQTKMELVYQYLTGPRFRQRVHAIVEKFTDMHQDLDKERRTMTRLWAKREEQIRSVLDTTASFYGDLQGIAGQSLQELDGLDVKLFDVPQ